MSTSGESAKSDTPKKSKARAKDKHDPVRFQGSGTNFRAKLIGVEAVAEARGDKMCQETLQKLKGAARSAGGHKQRVNINVSLEGLKIVDDKSGKTIHQHAVHRVSFIARDMTDNRAFGYIYSPGDGGHKFFGIKTEKAAEALVLSLRDLFQVVFEMKKREVEEAKRQKDENKENLAKEETFDRESIDSRGSRRSQETPHHLTVKTKFSDSHRASDRVGNLLSLEDQLLTLEQGLHQMTSDQWGVVPESPGGWSAGSDSWGTTPSTPRSLSQAPTDLSLSSSHSQPSSQQSVISAGGGFPTLPHSTHSMAFSIQPQSAHSVSTQAIPTLPKPRASTRSKTSLRRPDSVQSKGPGNTPPIIKASWATFDSPSPPEAHPLAKAPQAVLTSQVTVEEPVSAEKAEPADVSTLTESAPKAAGQSFGGLSGIEDPFKNDPFFSSTPATGVSGAPSEAKDKYSVFSDLGQPSFTAEDTSTVQGSESNPFGESSVFTAPNPTEAVSPPQDHSALNAAFASTPIQAPLSGHIPQPAGLDGNITSIAQDTVAGSDVHSSSADSASLKAADSPKPTQNEADPVDNSQVQVTKPTLLALSNKQPPKTVNDLHIAVGLRTPYDPFGDPMSPATEAKLNTSIGQSDDPFDTSTILRSLARGGPFDVSQLKPVNLDTSGSSRSEESPEKSIPLPSVPPPTLPTSTVMVLGEAPMPPPRPTTASTTTSSKSDGRASFLKKQITFDTSDIPPPPVPRRPPVTSSNTNKLLRQATIQFPVEPSEPPPPPPRPGLSNTNNTFGGSVTIKSLDDTSKPQNIDNLFSTSFVSQPATVAATAGITDQLLRSAGTSTQEKSDPFAVTLPQSKSKSSRSSVSPIQRARPRPRAKTPANTSSGFSLAGSSQITEAERPSSAAEITGRSSFGKGQSNVFGSKTGQQFTVGQTSSRDSPSISSTHQVADPFAGVDPFSEEGATDPFSDMPDPFESPMDPFSKNFTGELFTTKAVTLSTSEAQEEPPLADPDPFKDDPFAKDPFDSSSFSTLAGHTTRDKFGESTLRTDTSLEASVSLPVCSTSVEASSIMHEESANPQASNQSAASANLSDSPFQFDVFSSDFFKGQVNSNGLNNSVPNNSNNSWAFNCTTNDLITNKANSGWNAPIKSTQPNSSMMHNSGITLDRTSPNLHPYGITANRDNDSSSNSEIADAFGDDPFAHQTASQALDSQIAAAVGNPFI